jgi:intergrase/recombinase
MLRKWFYRTAKRVALEERADPILADFYQSRVSQLSVGERHYGELRKEADALYPAVMGELKHLL